MSASDRQTTQAEQPGLTAAPKPGRRRVPTSIRVLIVVALVAFLVLMAIKTTVVLYRNDGNAMAPSLRDRDYLAINRVAYTRNDRPQRGDLVVFTLQRAGGRRTAMVKRVIALPGESVAVRAGIVYIDDTPLAEPYVVEPVRYPFPPDGNGAFTVPAGTIFVLGDNRNNSMDSHAFGPVPLDSVFGKAIAIYSPADRAGFLQSQQYTTDEKER